MPKPSITIVAAVARLDGLQAAVCGRLHREAARLPESQRWPLRKLADLIGTDFERLRRELREGKPAETAGERAALDAGSDGR